MKLSRYYTIPVLLALAAVLLFHCGGTAVSYRYSKAGGEHIRTLTETARYLVGTPYRYGGSSPSGMDCSGLAVYLYRRAFSMALPHSTARLYTAGMAVPPRSARAGDLVFFRDDDGRVSHMGVLVDAVTFVHASSTRGVVMDTVTEAYFKRRLAGVRRIIEPRTSY